MTSDDEIRQNVESELKWSPDVDDTDIAVKVNGGVVTLTGFSRHYSEKQGAELAARRIKGVAAVANDIEVRRLTDNTPTDPEIARATIAALKIQLPSAWESIIPVVHRGHVALKGDVEWHYQRERAESAVRHLSGVISVSNSLRIKPSLVPGNIKQDIEHAFKRLAHVDADQISVDARGTEVTLRGELRSWAERDQALQTAWSAPGVTNVINELTVRT
jgi:osmotically-inducible protein OsmY